MAKRTNERGRAEQVTWERTQQLVEFGLLLGQKREQLGLSQTEMARRIGKDQSRISRIEMGIGTPKDFPTAQAYAECYQLDEHETNAWYQLLFGITQSHQATDDRQALVIHQASTLSDSASASQWGSIAATHLMGVATSLQEHFLWEDAIPLFRKAETLLGVTPQAAIAACETANTYAELGDYEAALQEILRVPARYAAVMNPELEYGVCFTRGWIDYEQGNFAQAASWFEQCLIKTAEIGSDQLSTNPHHFLGRVYCDWGKTMLPKQQAPALFQQATEHFDRAYKLHHTWGKQSDLAYDTFRTAQLLQAQGKWREAQHLRNSARSMFSTELELFTLHIDLEEAALMLSDGSKLDGPRDKAENALRNWALVKHAKGMANALSILGLVHSLGGKLDLALELYVVALCIYPFEQHLSNRYLWEKIQLIVHELIQENDLAYFNRLINSFQERAASRQGRFSHLDHVVANRSAAIARIFEQLRVLGMGL